MCTSLLVDSTFQIESQCVHFLSPRDLYHSSLFFKPFFFLNVKSRNVKRKTFFHFFFHLKTYRKVFVPPTVSWRQYTSQRIFGNFKFHPPIMIYLANDPFFQAFLKSGASNSSDNTSNNAGGNKVTSTGFKATVQATSAQRRALTAQRSTSDIDICL